MPGYEFEQTIFSLPSHTAATHLQRTEHLGAGVTSFRSQQVLTKLLPSHKRLIQKRHKPHQKGGRGEDAQGEASWAPQDQVLGACVSTQPREGPGGASSSALLNGGCCSGEDSWGFSLVGIVSAQGLAAHRAGAVSSQC